MKKTVLLVIITIAFLACKENKPPESFSKMFDKHGGINSWRKLQTLSFNKGEEVHTVDLHSRKTIINTPKYSLGFDGKEVWLDEVEKGIYKGNPTFYYNLYFYFYAMPFVLADDGITYSKVDALTFEGTKYPGYKISYAADKGTSPDDTYIVYYNPETFQMEWLAYTVTFKSKKPSKKYNIIKYDAWEAINGIVLPTEITWYKMDEKGMPTKPERPATAFTLPLISKDKLAALFFEKTKN
ncbi:MAG: hypothetical protein QMC35_11575 [Polaribacter sp.]